MLVIKINEFYTTIDVVAKKKATQSYQIATPENVVQNGDIILRDKIAEVITDFILKESLTHHTEVFFVIDSNKIFSRVEKLPNLSNKKISTAVQYNSTKWFPIDVADYKVIHTAGKNVNSVRNIHLTAVPNSITTTYKQIAQTINLEIVGIEYISNLQVLGLKGKSGLMLSIDTDAMHFMLLNKGDVASYKKVPIGMNTVIEPLNDEIIGRDADEIVEMMLNNAPEFSNYIEKVQSPLEFLASQINSTVSLLSTQLAVEFEQIYVIGEFSRTILVERMITDMITTKMEVLDISFAYPKTTKLLEDIKLQKTELKVEMPIYIPVTICTMLLIASVGVVLYCAVKKETYYSTIDSLNSEVVALSYVRGVEADFYAMSDSYAEVERIWAKTETHCENLNDYIELLEETLPIAVEVTSLALNGNSLSLGFRAHTYEDAILTINYLKGLDIVENVAFSVVNKTDMEGTSYSTVTYALECTLKEYVVINDYNEGFLYFEGEEGDENFLPEGYEEDIADFF